MAKPTHAELATAGLTADLEVLLGEGAGTPADTSGNGAAITLQEGAAGWITLGGSTNCNDTFINPQVDITTGLTFLTGVAHGWVLVINVYGWMAVIADTVADAASDPWGCVYSFGAPSDTMTWSGTGAPTTTSADLAYPTWTTDSVGDPAMHVNYGQAISVASSATLNATTGYSTVSAFDWVGPIDTYNCIVDKNVGQYAVLVLNDGRVCWGIPGGTEAYTTTYPITTGTRHVIGATYDGAHLVLYVDGALIQSTACTAALSANSISVLLGQQNATGGAALNAKLATQLVYKDRILTSGEMAAIYAMYTSTPPPPPPPSGSVCPLVQRRRILEAIAC